MRQAAGIAAWWLSAMLSLGVSLPADAQIALPVANPDDAKARAYGQHLGRECVVCHRLDGVDNGIPGIIGWPAETLIATMGFYRDGSRPNPAMASVAQSLDEAQISALAAYFASLTPAPKRASAIGGGAPPQAAPAKKK